MRHINLSPVIKTAYRNLRSTTLRTTLAMLGILVGTAAVVAMVSTGQMATEEALREFKNLGTELLSVSIHSKSQDEESGAKKFDLQQAIKLQLASKEIRLVAPYTTTYASVTYHGHSINGGIVGVTDALASVVKINIDQGRFISSLEHYEKHCVIGQEIYQKIKPYTRNPLGTTIKLGGEIYTIVGVAAQFPENSFLYQDINQSIMIPIQTTNFISASADINNVVMLLYPKADIKTVRSSLEKYLKDNVKNKEVFFRSAEELVKSMEAQHRIFTLLLSLIGSVSLLVGGIGVMNIMLVSVIERRREIGIRLALGARRKEIQGMFLTESVLLSMIGGLLGIVVGILSSFIVAVFLHWRFTVFVLPPLIGFSVSVLIGIFFGYYPAYKASQLDPIETLRSE